jgi:Ca-activated chloride channel homolog
MQTKRVFGCSILILLVLLAASLTIHTAAQVQDTSLARQNVSTAPARQTPSAQVQDVPPDVPDEIVRVDANLVTIPTVVTNREGQYVSDLHKEDFQIFEDGVEQEVAFLTPVERPFTILFLLDVSGSMSYRMEDLGRAANVFLDELRPNDKLIAASFHDHVKELCDVTNVSEVRESTKLHLRTGGRYTMLYDAVDYALRRMKKVPGRKAIVLFYDGCDSGISGIISGTYATAKRNLHDAEEQEALIYTVQFDTHPPEPPPHVSKKDFYESIEAANSYMGTLAQKTGGRYYQVENISDLGKTFGLVAEDLRRQYSLGYYPKQRLQAGQVRQLKVRMRLPGLAVRARASYTVDKNLAQGK